MADSTTPQGKKLVKRRPVGASRSPSRERGQAAAGPHYTAHDAPAIPTLDPNASSAEPVMGGDSEKDKKSKWRLSNPFHSKDKEREKEKKETRRDATGPTDSAYFSDNVNSTRSDNVSSGDPSFVSSERRNSRGDQLQPQAEGSLRPSSDAPTLPATTPSEAADPQSAGNKVNQTSPAAAAAPKAPSQEQVKQETYEDRRTGCVVTTTTTTGNFHSSVRCSQY